MTSAGLTRHYVRPAEVVNAVQDVDLSLESGQFVLLRGPSGAGKSTLIRLLAGLEVPDAGSVRIQDRSLAEMSSDQTAALRASEIGVVFQHNNLILEFTALENVMLPMELRGQRGAEVRSVASQWLARLGLGGMEDRFPLELSGGQQQRVGIARALAGGRSVLLADEPTGALDSENAAALFECIRDLTRDGLLALVSSHDPLADQFADRILNMRDGRLLEVERG